MDGPVEHRAPLRLVIPQLADAHGSGVNREIALIRMAACMNFTHESTPGFRQRRSNASRTTRTDHATRTATDEHGRTPDRAWTPLANPLRTHLAVHGFAVRAALLGLCLALLTPSAFAQFGLPGLGEKKVQWTAAFEPAKAAPGQTATLRVKADIAEGWHIYGMNLSNKGPIPTTFEAAWPEGWTPVGDWTPDVAPKAAIDPGFQFEVAYHEGEVGFRHAVRIPAGQPLGPVEMKGRVRSQACDDSQCLPPLWVDWTAALEIVSIADAPAQQVLSPTASLAPTEPPSGAASGAAPVSTSASRPPSPPQSATDSPSKSAANDTELQTLRKEGLGAFLLFAIVAGLASLLTPCVFPMVPITVSFFTKRSDRTPRQGVMLAFVYAAGIVVTFSLLGLLMSAVLGVAKGVGGAGAAQGIAANPWVNFALAGLFIFFALSLFGLFDIQLPTGIANKLQRAGSGRADVMGALVMAVVFTVTSFTCTVQFVGWLLVEAARGSWLWPGIGMVAYSAAFASPFFLLALFPQALARLPRSGPWLHSTKVVMGFLELAAAFKFVSNSDLVWQWGFFNREIVLAAWAAIALFTGLYLMGMIRLTGEPGAKSEIGTLRMILSMTFVATGLYLASGLVGTRLHGLVETYLPPRLPGAAEVSRVGPGGGGGGGNSGESSSSMAGLSWIKNYESGLEQARKEQRPVFIDFTGVTCTNCRWMEINIFERPEIRELLGRYTRLQLYTDTGDVEAEAHQRIQADRFGTVALPFYAILRPDGTVVDTHGGIMRSPADFAEFLRQGLES